MSSILVVDDVADIRYLCRIVLESRGHAVTEADTGESACAALSQSPPDYLLLDIRLPGIDGWEVLRVIRGRADLDRLKVIVCSAHASPADARKAQAEGAWRFLGKPFFPEELIDVFERCDAQPSPDSFGPELKISS